MENITLLPARANSTLYKANRKQCSNGCIVLEDRITDYSLSVSDTTSITVDTSLLNEPQNSSIEFTLYVYSTKSNVLNFDGFSMQQLEVGHGESIFNIHSSNGKWIIIPKQICGYKQERLKAGACPNGRTQVGPGSYFYGILSLTGNEQNERDYSNIFDNDVQFGVTHTTYSGRFYKDLGDIICYVRYPSPVMVTNFAMMFHRDYSGGMPDSVTIWGSNDSENWTQILHKTVTEKSNGKHYMFDVDEFGFYELLKFQFHYNENAGYSYYYLPLMQIIGFRNETHYRFIRAMPELSGNPPCNGYNIEFGEENTWDRDIVYRLTQLAVESNCNIYRPNQGVPWTIIYSFPEAFRAYAFFHCTRYTNGALAEFKLYGSHDKKNWVEFYHYKKDRSDLSIRYPEYGYRTFLVDSIYDYKYYKVEVYQTRNNENISYTCSYHFMRKLKLDYLGFDTNIPKLSSNNENGYKLTSTSIVTGNLYNLFNQNNTSYMEADLENGEWELIIKLPQATKYNRLSFRNYKDETYRNPVRFKILGSNDDEEYDELREWTETLYRWDNNNYQTESYHFANDTAYRYYKLVILQVRSGTRIRMYDVGLSFDAPFIQAPYYTDSYIVPVMSANSQDGYVASASSSYSSSCLPWHAFDRDNGVNYKWLTSSGDVSGSWLKIELPTAQHVPIFCIQTPNESGYLNRVPTSFKIQGSNDDNDWTDLVEVSNVSWSNSETKKWINTSETAYKYYRLLISANGGANMVAIGRWDFVNREYTKLYSEIRDDDYLVPELKSNNHMGYTVTASSYVSNNTTTYDPWKAFNRKQGTQYNSWFAQDTPSGEGGIDAWIQVQLPIAKVCNKIKLSAPYGGSIYPNQAPKDFTFKGSNDGENWTTLYSATDQLYTSTICNEYTFANENAYIYYRLCMTKMNTTSSSANPGISSFWLCYQHAHADRYVIDDDERLVPGGLNSESALSSAGYYASASSQYNTNFVPWKAFYAYCPDDTNSNGWVANSSERSDAYGNCDSWIQIQLPEAKICNRVILNYRVYTYGCELPYEFEVLGSNDGENFDTLVEYRGHELHQKSYSVDFDNETAYLYYRIHFSKTTEGSKVASVGYISLKRRIFEPIPEEIEESEGE